MKVLNSSGLLDADWAEIKRLNDAFNESGEAAMQAEMDKLCARDFEQFIRIVDATTDPVEMREAILDEMAERGMTREDIEDLRKQAAAKVRKNIQ